MSWRNLAFLISALVGPVLMAQPVLADARQDVVFGVQRCAGIADDRTWLDCFYGSAQPMRARLGLPPAPANQQRLVPTAPASAYAAPTYAAPTYAAPAYAAPAYAPPGAPANSQQAAMGPPGPPPLPRRQSTGFFGSMFGSSKAVVSKIRMASWNRGKDGQFVVTLTDGQIWQQDPGDVTIPNWRNPVSRHVVSIYEGALGSYNMNVSDDSTLYKVHRLN